MQLYGDVVHEEFATRKGLTVLGIEVFEVRKLVDELVRRRGLERISW